MKSVTHERMHSAAAWTSAWAARRQGLLPLLLGDLELAVGAEEVRREPVEEAASRSSSELALHAGDRVEVEGAVGVVVVLEQARRDRRGEDEAVHAVLTVGADVAGHLAAAHREPDEADVLQVELGRAGRRGRW